MLPLLTAQQIHEADAYTISHEPVTSVNLMERASKAFVSRFMQHFPDKAQTISAYCGSGNNGGDGLAIARMLNEHGYRQLNVKVVRFSDKATDDFNTNLHRFQHLSVPLLEIEKGGNFPPEDSAIIIDALLGSGLNKPLSGDYEQLVKHLNQLEKTVVAVDVPTGLPTEGAVSKEATILKAKLVITFQQPKINFLLPESGPHMESWEAVDIGLDDTYLQSLNSPYQLIEKGDIKTILKPRHKFSNKGTYGHALLVAGQAKTMGAALLCSSACVYAGAGLTTVCIPESGLTALNSYQAEVMAIIREQDQLPEIEWDKFSVIGVGPGLGKDDNALALLKNILANYHKPMIIDADALNLLATHQELLQQLPKGSIVTPHMKEFDRLFGEHDTWWNRLQTLKQKAQELQINIVLKNDYTITGTPDGKLYFNSTSNAAMASGGMGDILTGIITALVAQKYTPEQACLAGVYLHGKAGDVLALPNQLHVVLPGQVAAKIPAVIAQLTA
ncbi:NAD(P)H-hydrate dehydratase [Mucilaginibacter robiniae]|uniref:Bifunctional NAD(P)H-hydrate repair enzyme n=1 Tax=Mucilaginibacter robiniae TaxID=2728022 RepID=A0A7L5E4X7_9SPHI|nr:NAD(P)H-hydrate dehydratase [Mucilaginibacter robiniae]QJD96804.1 NAD(P)H-hydrate dehydratase [Mucilaginibacter robiniae]